MARQTSKACSSCWKKRGRRIGSALVEARSDRNAGRHIIHVGRDHDSHLIIPVLPAQD